jgi:hypothetical protein
LRPRLSRLSASRKAGRGKRKKLGLFEKLCVGRMGERKEGAHLIGASKDKEKAPSLTTIDKLQCDSNWKKQVAVNFKKSEVKEGSILGLSSVSVSLQI